MINNDSPMPPSPWKKPRMSIKLSKTKSFKRRSEAFNQSTNNDSINSPAGNRTALEGSIVEEDCGQKSKERKTIINRFSVKNPFTFGGSNENSFNTSNLNDSANKSVAEVGLSFLA